MTGVICCPFAKRCLPEIRGVMSKPMIRQYIGAEDPIPRFSN